MKLVVISHKETWSDPASPCGYSTVGGFPFQMQAISSLFDETRLMIPIQSSPLPSGAIPLHGHNLCVIPLLEPKGVRWQRKLSMLPWTLNHLPLLWHEVAGADAIHTPVGGDIGTIGIFIALLQHKPLFVRHCGTWSQPISWVDAFLQRFLEWIAGGHNVVLATGGAERLPSGRNPHIAWIFSTTLSQGELDETPLATPWDGVSPLRLITVGRLSEPKNLHSLMRALSLIRREHPGVHLDILGDGETRFALEALTSELEITDSVTFYGNVSHAQVMQALSASHLFVFPSLREGFPKALLEALACGLPVVATRISVIPQLLQNGCGVLLDDPSPDAVARAVLQVASDPARMNRMGKLGRDTARGYTLEAWAEAIGRHLRRAWGPLKAGEA